MSVPVTGIEHWTSKGDVRLFLWEKFAGESPAGKHGTILFVHGSSMASQPTFDLQVPGRTDSSVMDVFARAGYDCWCLDNEGYGRSSKHRDITCDISNGADDLAAAAAYIEATRHAGPLLVYGISSGALKAALFAQRNPGRVKRLAGRSQLLRSSGAREIGFAGCVDLPQSVRCRRQYRQAYRV
jgi:alpha-beta hydrolase superfamily lysophospholipase